MCGRATVVNPDGITEKLYGYTKKFTPSDFRPRYNLNPREEIPAVYYDPFLRQRVLLSPDAYDRWLDPAVKRGQLELLNGSAFHRDGELEHFPISRLVNNPGYDAADCLERASAEEMNQPPARAKERSAQIDLGI